MKIHRCEIVPGILELKKICSHAEAKNKNCPSITGVACMIPTGKPEMHSASHPLQLVYVSDNFFFIQDRSNYDVKNKKASSKFPDIFATTWGTMLGNPIAFSSYAAIRVLGPDVHRLLASEASGHGGMTLGHTGHILRTAGTMTHVTHVGCKSGLSP